MPYANIDDYRAYQKVYQREWSRRNRDRRLRYETSWVERNREKRREYVKKTLPIKKWCRNTLARSIKLGRIVRGVCEICGDSNPQAHHDDYSLPLVVRWLCRKHHFELHRKYK